MTDNQKKKKIVKSELLKRISKHEFTNKMYCLNCYCLDLLQYFGINVKCLKTLDDIHTWL